MRVVRSAAAVLGKWPVSSDGLRDITAGIAPPKGDRIPLKSTLCDRMPLLGSLPYVIEQRNCVQDNVELILITEHDKTLINHKYL